MESKEQMKTMQSIIRPSKQMASLARTVGNIAEYDDRDLLNVCVKTTMSGDRNASSLFPKVGARLHFRSR